MAIQLDEPRTPGLPVVKSTALGQTFVGMLVRKTTRGRIKNNQPYMTPDGKRQRQELVLTVLTLPGTTAPAGIGGVIGIPEPGELVRIIQRGAGFAEWIEQTRELDGPSQVGDVITTTTTHGQRYTADGETIGKQITTQAELDAVPRGTSVGIYGPLTVRRATPDEAAWVAKAEAAYHETAPKITLDDTGPNVDDF